MIPLAYTAALLAILTAFTVAVGRHERAEQIKENNQ